MRLALFSLVLTVILNAQLYEINRLESTLFSKKSLDLKSVTLSLVLEGGDLVVNQLKIQDALNILISSYYVEDLMTSKGKESFKESLIKFIKEKYHIHLSNIYFKELRLTNPPIEIDELIERLKREGCCQGKSKIKDLFNQTKNPQ